MHRFTWNENDLSSRRRVNVKDYFGTSDYFSGRKKKKNLFDQNFDGEANWSDVVTFPCMQMRQVMSRRFIFRRWLKWRAMFTTVFFKCNFSQIEALDFLVFTHAYSKIVEYDIKGKYPEEYSTVDKVRSEKLLARKSCFMYNKTLWESTLRRRCTTRVWCFLMCVRDDVWVVQ